jgi:hypothetical protein
LHRSFSDISAPSAEICQLFFSNYASYLLKINEFVTKLAQLRQTILIILLIEWLMRSLKKLLLRTKLCQCIAFRLLVIYLAHFKVINSLAKNYEPTNLTN